MMYLHDVWVSWSYGGDKSYLTPEFFEWRKEDSIELLEQLPLIPVEEDFFTAVDNGYPELPQELLDVVKGRTYLRKNHEKHRLDYCVALSDKKRVLVIYTQGTTEPVCKSKLIPRQARLALDMVYDLLPMKYEVPSTPRAPKEDSILDKMSTIEPEYMRGLTRKERELKEILLDCLFTLGCSTNHAEVGYWYAEMFPGTYEKTKYLTIPEMLEDMFDNIKYGWEKKHVEFGDNIVKFSDLYCELWINLKKQDVKKEMVKTGGNGKKKKGE